MKIVKSYFNSCHQSQQDDEFYLNKWSKRILTYWDWIKERVKEKKLEANMHLLLKLKYVVPKVLMYKILTGLEALYPEFLESDSEDCEKKEGGKKKISCTFTHTPFNKGLPLPNVIRIKPNRKKRSNLPQDLTSQTQGRLNIIAKGIFALAVGS